jgi:hypothetical protein
MGFFSHKLGIRLPAKLILPKLYANNVSTLLLPHNLPFQHQHYYLWGYFPTGLHGVMEIHQVQNL